jgi:hypothetical protein
MSFHHNEKNEWLRFGAAIYLDHCDGFSVTRATATGGQCGLMLNASKKGTVAGCNFSFLSAIGYRTVPVLGEQIQQNRIDWCVRGYSHGVYNRGQDSAGILVYEQQHENIFAYNSVTHGGDGFFLWAGQTTMDTGQGGCNDNLVYGNDFFPLPDQRYRNDFLPEHVRQQQGLRVLARVWGGYSFGSKFVGNHFGYNAEAVAIEHGQNNAITGNVFFRDNTGIRLWENAKQDPDWAYPKTRDTRSHAIASRAIRSRPCARTITASPGKSPRRTIPADTSGSRDNAAVRRSDPRDRRNRLRRPFSDTGLEAIRAADRRHQRTPDAWPVRGPVPAAGNAAGSALHHRG